MTDLMEKLKKNSTIKEAAILSRSKIFDNRDISPTPIPIMNVGLSGDPAGGLTTGITQIAGPSKHFKTLFGLLQVKAYMDHHEDAVVLFYENEFGTTRKYFDSLNIDRDRVLHSPITDVEILKSDIMNQLDDIQRGDHVIILIDSIGNIASRKEVEDALDKKVVVDMTRAKALKSLFRMVTPHITLKDLPLIVINHTYKTIEMFSKEETSGGTGSVYASDTIWVVGRQQEKDKDKALIGYNFTINIRKSRYVKENSKFNITVTFDQGIKKWSGLFENALEGGYISKISKGKYQRIDLETGEFVGEEFTETEALDMNEMWETIMEETNFKEFLISKYRLGEVKLIQDVLEEMEENDED